MNTSDGTPVLKEDSFVVCKVGGGAITPVDSGQALEDNNQNTDKAAATGIEIVYMNGKMLQVDTANPDTVIKLFKEFDSMATKKFIIFDRILVYSYAAKNVIKIKCEKGKSIKDILIGLGFSTEPKRPAHVRSLENDSDGNKNYYVRAQDKYRHKLGLDNIKVQAFLDTLSYKDSVSSANLRHKFKEYSDVAYALYIYSNYGIDKGKKILKELNWNTFFIGESAICYELGQDEVYLNELEGWARHRTLENQRTILTMVLLQWGNKIAEQSLYGPDGIIYDPKSKLDMSSFALPAATRCTRWAKKLSGVS